jgi:hypothetical protein
MKLPSILFASVVTLPLLVVASQNESTWGKDLGPINDFMLNPTDENAAKKCTDAGGTVYRDDKHNERCHPRPPPSPPCVGKNNHGEHCDDDTTIAVTTNVSNGHGFPSDGKDDH